ncbi:hypothetical protein IFM89_023367 [Coptis chinensis]|uniref:Uncharacterized protein n=1 Tax=Coptis chinensis TaxID=261450 RepID=A0A835I7A9_9MAGN|nr:hypothetical protein IFM89_023367 [Coptis chinensis]
MDVHQQVIRPDLSNNPPVKILELSFLFPNQVVDPNQQLNQRRLAIKDGGGDDLGLDFGIRAQIAHHKNWVARLLPQVCDEGRRRSNFPLQTLCSLPNFSKWAHKKQAQGTPTPQYEPVHRAQGHQTNHDCHQPPATNGAPHDEYIDSLPMLVHGNCRQPRQLAPKFDPLVSSSSFSPPRRHVHAQFGFHTWAYNQQAQGQVNADILARDRAMVADLRDEALQNLMTYQDSMKRKAGKIVDIQNIKHIAENKKTFGDVMEKIVEDWNTQKDVFHQHSGSKQGPTENGNEVVCYQPNGLDPRLNEDVEEVDDFGKELELLLS